MARHLLRVLIYVLFLASLAYYLFVPYSDSVVDKLFISVGLIILGSLVVWLLEGVAERAVKDRRDRYELKQIATYLIYLLALVVAVMVWVQNPETLIIGLGLIGASIVMVYQEPILSIGGFAYIIIVRPFVVGDRIEIGGKTGDVIDISLFNTKLMEIHGWVGADQATGRIIVVPNSEAFRQSVFNYTKDFIFIWDSINIPLTYDSNWKKASKLLLETAKKQQKKYITIVDKEIDTLSKKYFFSSREVKPQVYVEVTDNWIMLSLRYIAPARERRLINNAIFTEAWEKLDKQKDIEVSSQTFMNTVLLKKK